MTRTHLYDVREALAAGIELDEELLQMQLQRVSAQPQPWPRVILHGVADRLHDMPTLLAPAQIGEQRAIIIECIDQIYAHRKTITAIRPTALFEPLLLAARDRVIDPGYRSAEPCAVLRLSCQT